MRHRKSHRKLGRRSDHRRAMLRNLATSFLSEGRIQTTLPRAKELRPFVEKLITWGKKGSLAARRHIAAVLYTEASQGKVCGELKDRFASRPGGYTKIIKHGPRFGDGADICQLELVDYHEYEGKTKAAARKKADERRNAAAEAKPS